MLVLLSPAKTFEESREITKKIPFRLPAFYAKSQQLVAKLKNYSVAELEKMYEASEKIAELNYNRYQNWPAELSAENTRPAAFSFWGDVNKYFDAYSLSRAELETADSQVIYLSGLYGLVRPLDAIHLYRLEMGTDFSPNADCKNLYQFWEDDIAEYINNRASAEKHKLIVNLASKEYFGAVNAKKLNIPVVEIVFKEQRKGTYKVISLIAKRSRGLFARWIVKNKPKSLNDLKKFAEEGYYLDPQQSNDTKLTFLRDEVTE